MQSEFSESTGPTSLTSETSAAPICQQLDLLTCSLEASLVSRGQGGGYQLGKDDPRHLWPTMRNVVETVRPTWVVGENVVGLLDSGITQVCDDLEDLSYSVQSLVIPASAVGAWHERERVWILAHNEAQHRNARNCVVQGGERGASPQPRGLHCNNLVEGRESTHSGFKCEPRLVRLVHGVPNRTHRLKGLGNAIVPQVAFEILKPIAQLIASGAS